MIATPKTSAPFVPTDKLETLARELFNGALPALPSDGMKRRQLLAREFTAAHLSIAGVAKPDAKKYAALAPAFRAIADSRQARVGAFLKNIVPKPTEASVRQQLVDVLGEQALALRLLNAGHSIATALVLLDHLEGKTGTQLDLSHGDADKFTARLDAALPGARQHFYPGGNVNHSLRGLALLAQLADALADSNGGNVTTAPQTPTAGAQRKPATTPEKPAPKAAGPMKLAAFDTLSPREKMSFIKCGGQLTD